MSFIGNFSLALLAGSLFSFDAMKDKADEVVNSYKGKENSDLYEDIGANLLRHGANIISGCKFNCPGKVKPRPNTRYLSKVKPDGCGAYGFKLFLSHLKELESCCNDHDTCYSTCNKDKKQCDVTFDKCLREYCKSIIKRKYIFCCIET